MIRSDRPSKYHFHTKHRRKLCKKIFRITVLAAATLLATSTLVSAHHLATPTNLVCPIVGLDSSQLGRCRRRDEIFRHVVATYDTGITGDPTDDTIMEWDFGTGDRTDGLPIAQSDLMIPLRGLNHDFGTAQDRNRPLLPNFASRVCFPEKANNAKITCFLIFVRPLHQPHTKPFATRYLTRKVFRCFFQCEVKFVTGAIRDLIFTLEWTTNSINAWRST